MDRRRFLALTLAGCLIAAPAAARDIVDRLLAELRANGFVDIDVSRTLLGRTRIVAATKKALREIVVDPRTGEILRDYWQFFDDDGGSGSDDDDDDDDDKSGHGSGSGGSGSGGSGSGGSGSGGSGSGGG